MPTAQLTPRKLHARVESTSELLRDIASENLQTLRELKPQDLSTELWFQYRKLAEQIQATATDATAFAGVLGDFANLTPLRSHDAARSAP